MVTSCRFFAARIFIAICAFQSILLHLLVIILIVIIIIIITATTAIIVIVVYCVG